MNEAIEEILKGSFDLHVHAGPDPNQDRRLDALETARQAYEAEMGGFVLKSHDYPTAPLTYALNRMYPGLLVVGSIVLNEAVGGYTGRGCASDLECDDLSSLWDFETSYWIQFAGFPRRLKEKAATSRRTPK